MVIEQLVEGAARNAGERDDVPDRHTFVPSAAGKRRWDRGEDALALIVRNDRGYSPGLNISPPPKDRRRRLSAEDELAHKEVARALR